MTPSQSDAGPAVEGIRVAEHAPRLFERDPVLDAVDRGLPPIPLEHGSVYTKAMARTSETSSPHTSMRKLLNESEMVGRVPWEHLTQELSLITPVEEVFITLVLGGVR